MVHVYKYPWNISMNYYIEKHDMEIILDALENLVADMKHSRDNGHYRLLDYPYSIEDVTGLLQSFDNSHKEDVNA
jgi:hypothetical protein